MSASQVDPHDKKRSRDVNKVAKGEQVPRPAHDPSTVSRPPPPKQVDEELSKPKGSAHSDDGKSSEPGKWSEEEEEEEEVIVLETAPLDMRFPFANQTRHCYARYLEYLRRIQEKGKDAPECEKFAKYYRSLCPSEWIERWNEQREQGTFPGPI
ncbi:cytochrome c oxidase subunit 6b-3-like [Rhodamnia argentea]|uniref:Cytochrome c oxidase subunit 6b-3-like n=1 Tax=Rhodamnia argentea TaxID=178133 RepID=A0ABM3H6D1_9MYRT|nr:cytochrome c oxidase subunit 6b-3-like [Rhodamnia argentea]